MPTDDTSQIVRRAPFATNPRVGARGQRTQQQILDAALRVFGEVGYHQCNIARITKLAGCSRVSFYQYFSSKEEVFRQLGGQVVRQLSASSEALPPLTPGHDGWSAIRAWVARHADVYDRYQPVFAVGHAAIESDETVASVSTRIVQRDVALIRSKLTGTPLTPRQLDPLITLLLECVTHTLDTARMLRSAAPDAYQPERVEDALADVVHRSLFGLSGDVNVHSPARRRPPELEFGPAMREALHSEDHASQLTAAGRRTLEALMKAGRDVLVSRGYHGTRVDDIVTAAGVSHGAFYRYFKGKDRFAQVLAVQAIRTVSETLTAIPSDTAELRRWLRRYNETQAKETSMLHVWADAALGDPALRADSAAILDWGRRQMVRYLEPRDFGDVDTEAVVMMALLSVFGARERSAPTVDAMARIVERGLLGH